MKRIIVGVLVLFVGLIGYELYGEWYEATYCIKYEKQIVHHPPMSILYPGNKVPVIRPSYDALEDVCVEYRK